MDDLSDLDATPPCRGDPHPLAAFRRVEAYRVGVKRLAGAGSLSLPRPPRQFACCGQMVSSTQRPDRELAAEPRSTAYLQLGRGRQPGWEDTEKFSVPCSIPKLANQVTLGEISSRNATWKFRRRWRRSAAPLERPCSFRFGSMMPSNRAWAADVRRTRYIRDSCNWKDHDSSKSAFERLLRDLKAKGSKAAPA
jgi:hypothetical protein